MKRTHAEVVPEDPAERALHERETAAVSRDGGEAEVGRDLELDRAEGRTVVVLRHSVTHVVDRVEKGGGVDNRAPLVAAKDDPAWARHGADGHVQAHPHAGVEDDHAGL